VKLAAISKIFAIEKIATMRNRPGSDRGCWLSNPVHYLKEPPPANENCDNAEPRAVATGWLVFNYRASGCRVHFIPVARTTAVATDASSTLKCYMGQALIFKATGRLVRQKIGYGISKSFSVTNIVYCRDYTHGLPSLLLHRFHACFELHFAFSALRFFPGLQFAEMTS